LASIAYLSIIPADALREVRGLAVNFHDGPLPQLAGLNVTSWAILRHEKEHGVTWHALTERADEAFQMQKVVKKLSMGVELPLVIDSTEVGVEKPDPRIFQIALDRMGVSAADALYVGDLYEVDVVGARAAGLDVVLLDANGEHTGIQVAGLPGEWFTAPATLVQGPFMKGAPDNPQHPPATGDSGVIDAFGLGGQGLRQDPRPIDAEPANRTTR